MSSTPNTAPAWGILRIADVKAVTGICSPNERFIHMNINRVVNKAVGLKAGQRPSAPLPQQALLVVAQHVATQALQQADDHRDGYQVAKDAVLNLSRALLLGGAA